MATISASLQLFDQFTTTLDKAERGINSVITAAERLKRELSATITLNMSATDALTEINKVKHQIHTINSTAPILIILDDSDVAWQIPLIKGNVERGLSHVLAKVVLASFDAIEDAKRLSSRLEGHLKLPKIKVDMNVSAVVGKIASLKTLLVGVTGGLLKIEIGLNSAEVIAEAVHLRQRIITAIGTIQADIQVTLPTALTDLLQNIRKLVLLLLLGIRKLLKSSLPPGPPKPPPPPPGSSSGAPSDGGKSEGLLGRLRGIAAEYLNIANAQKLLEATLGAAMKQGDMEAMFKARTGNDQVGTAMFQHFKERAMQAGEDVNESLKNTLAFFPMTQNTDQLDKLHDLTLYLGDTNGKGKTSEDAVDALKSAMKGDTGALSDDFNIPESVLKKFKIEDLAKQNKMPEFLTALEKAMDSQNMGKAAYDKIGASPGKQFGDLKTNATTAMANSGTQALNTIAPVIEMLNKAFEDKKFQPFFDGLSIGLNMAAQGVAFLVNQAMWLWGVMQANWPIVRSILLGIAMVISGVVVAALIEMAVAWLTAAWPILLIAAIVVGLMLVLQQFGVTTEQIIGAIIGFFYALYAGIYNYIALLWNVFASFVEYLYNIFIDPLYAIQSLFYELAMVVLNYLDVMTRSVEGFTQSFYRMMAEAANAVIGVWNDLGGAFNKFFGTQTFQPVTPFDIENIKGANSVVKGLMSSLQKPTTTKDVLKLTRMDMLDPVAMAQQGYSVGVDLVGNMKAMEMPKADQNLLSGWNTNHKANIGKVDTVGNIEDTVDISSEDLKVMRDIAEMQSIQNFVSLTPTVQVQTGDINNGADVHDIIKRIGDHLEEQFTSSAKGTYT
ncbi:hypothetical protein [Paenibacillus sp. FSL H7-0331]|uniref:hypothetical protein n=1 Tax=Paenibacillus sp. FSL H7-0331 TaxID=1920421 RepID=UPI00096FE6DC|nr:hypothetical protein [Paenibacillus sp. FSL H7-0331]OMF12336.1 hypothetical protein BK127_22975 [Paenibacillus sp. FSL H7-0331]